MKTVGIMSIGNNVSLEYMHFDRLKSVVDTTVVLLDNADVDIDADCIIKMKYPESIPWNDNANIFTNLIMAARMEADWYFVLDSDEDFDYRLQTKDDLKNLIAFAEKDNCTVINGPFREMWEKPDEYRSDGIWGRKTRIRIRKNWLKEEHVVIKNPLGYRLHSSVWGVNYPHKIYQSDYAIYHYGCYNEFMRQQRVNKYKQCDPNNVFQPMGYYYMLDYTNLETKKIERVI